MDKTKKNNSKKMSDDKKVNIFNVVMAIITIIVIAGVIYLEGRGTYFPPIDPRNIVY